MEQVILHPNKEEAAAAAFLLSELNRCRRENEPSILSGPHSIPITYKSLSFSTRRKISLDFAPLAARAQKAQEVSERFRLLREAPIVAEESSILLLAEAPAPIGQSVSTQLDITSLGMGLFPTDDTLTAAAGSGDDKYYAYDSCATPTNDDANCCFCVTTDIKAKDDMASLIDPIIRSLPSNAGMPLEDYEQLVTAENGNNRCIDCDELNPEWASLGFGTVCCLRCAGKHRSFGTHVTLVRSIKMDEWSREQIACVRLGGNRNFLEYLHSFLEEKNHLLDTFDKYYLPEVSYYR